MSWSEIIIGGIIGGGLGGAITGGIINHLSNKKLFKLNLINESQFKAFNELWKTLTDLKIEADELWEKTNDKNLLKFISSLKKAVYVVELNALILSKEDYDKLKKILEEFSDYRIGKTRLIDIDKGKIKDETIYGQTPSGARTIYNERMNQVFRNESSKRQYESLLEELRNKFRVRMGVN